MESKQRLSLKRGMNLFCLIYTFATIISSSLQLYMGSLTDTNSHILNRAIIVLIAVIIITLFENIKFQNKVLSYLIPYIISMIIVFSYVWISGNFVELHPNAYRDIFLNFTGVTIIYCVVENIVKKSKKKQNI